jgi:hypothetical protein
MEDHFVFLICFFLCDTDKLNLLSTSTKLNNNRKKIIFNTLLNLSRIENLINFNNFISVKVTDKCILSLNNISNKYIHNICNKNIRLAKNFGKNNVKKCNLPSRTKYLIFGSRFNEKIEDCIYSIPNTITHLTFGNRFNQDIKNIIPNSVTHLKFGNKFNKDIKDCIPNSVKYLTFGRSFNQNIKNCIPYFVTNIEFGYNFNQDLENCIPESVTHIIFNNALYYKKIKHQIPKLIKIKVH